jgi:transketolase
MNKNRETIDQLCINTIRFLAVDMVEKAQSGHPGAPMGIAPVAYILWDRFLKHDPTDPKWVDRDRFVLSCGHASALLYALLHLTEYDLSLDDLKNFRQWGSKTPGHPEYGLVPGVETTTGLLGQGFANAVGMALAEKRLATQFNRSGCEIIDHHTYVLVSDGDLMEGISHEAASLAGSWKLNKLIAFYDSNDISIDGSTKLAFNDDITKRFESTGWQVIGPVDGLDLLAVESSVQSAREEQFKPTLIIFKTIIGYGSPNQDTAKTHGEPLGSENTVAAKKRLKWQVGQTFYVPEEVRSHFRQSAQRRNTSIIAWQQNWARYRSEYPELAAQFLSQMSGELPPNWDNGLGRLFTDLDKPISTRIASGQILNIVESKFPALIGGSADLSQSNQTILRQRGDFSADEPGGSNLHFGVREHAMAAIANGMSLHGGLVPFIGTFLIFSDYMRPSIRLAALMGIRVIYVFTHDSIGVGEDGPTHQPVEQLMSLRLIPNLTIIRPADAEETTEAWRIAINNKSTPTAIILTRQAVPILDRLKCSGAQGTRQGAYILRESTESIPDIILIGTGSETSLALKAGEILAGDGINVRVVSLPSWELFEQQSIEYRQSVFPSEVSRRVAVEAGIGWGWERYLGNDGVFIGMNNFGASAPGSTLYEKFGITEKSVYQAAQELLIRKKTQDERL